MSCEQARRKQFEMGGGGGIPGGSPSRGSGVMSKNVCKRGGGGRRKICVTTTLTRYMQAPERFSKWTINDQVERKLAWVPGHEPLQGVVGYPEPLEAQGF